jgi:hypothetical protein
MEVRETVYCWWECKLVQPENNMEFPQKTKHGNIICSSNCTSEYLPKGVKSLSG